MLGVKKKSRLLLMDELRKLGISFQILGSSLIVIRPATLGGAITVVPGQKLKTTIDGQTYDIKVNGITTDASSIFRDMSVECNHKIFYMYNVDRFDHFFSVHSDKLGPTLEFWKSIVHDVYSIEYINSGKIIMNHRLTILAGQSFQTTIARRQNWGAWAKQRIDFDFSLRSGIPIIIYGKFVSFDQKEATISVDFNLMEKIAMGAGVLGLAAAATYMGKKLPKPEDAANPTDKAPTVEAPLAVEYPDDVKAMLDSQAKADALAAQKYITPEQKNIAKRKEAAILKLHDKKGSRWSFQQHTFKTKEEARAYLEQRKDDGHYSQHSYDKLSSALKGGGFISFKVPIQDATILFWQNLQLT